MTLSREQAAKDIEQKCGFVIERRDGVSVIVWTVAGCRPADVAEVRLWVYAITEHIALHEAHAEITRLRGELDAAKQVIRAALPCIRNSDRGERHAVYAKADKIANSTELRAREER